jgi:hypothetical protein
MKGLLLADWLVIAAYLIGITPIGFLGARRVKSAASFFITDRRFGTLLTTFLAPGSGTHADQAVSVAAKTYRVGVSGIWYQWIYLFLTPYLLAGPVKHLRQPAPKWGSVFCKRQNSAPGNDTTARHEVGGTGRGVTYSYRREQTCPPRFDTPQATAGRLTLQPGKKQWSRPRLPQSI